MGALATLASEVRGSREGCGDLTCRFPRGRPNTLFACVSLAAFFAVPGRSGLACSDSHEHHVPALCSAVDPLAAERPDAEPALGWICRLYRREVGQSVQTDFSDLLHAVAMHRWPQFKGKPPDR